MKKKAYIAIAAVLCAGLLVTAACLRGGKPDDNIPDNLQMNDTQTPDENKPDDTQKPSDTQTPDNTTKPDDTQKPNDIQQPDDTLTPDEVKYVEVYRHPDNEKALQAYYDFLKNGGKARLAGESRELTLAETFEIMYAKAHDEFAFFDFGSDGIQELAIKTYHEYLVLFWENDRLYMDNVGVREMNAGYNGFETTGSNLSGNESRTGFVLKTFSAERGMDSLSLGYSIYNIDTGARSRYIYRELVDGEWVDRENTAVTEEAFQAYIAEFENAPSSSGIL